MSDDIFDSLLGFLNIDQIDALIHQEELKIDGYRIFFVIDASELHNYAYPLGLEGTRSIVSKINYEYIADEQIANYTLFNTEDFKAFILDGHFDEIAGLINGVKKREIEGETIISSVRKFSEYLKVKTSYDLNELSEKWQEIQQNIPLILSIAVGLQADGVQKLYNLFSENKLLINGEDLRNHFEEEDYVSLFDDSRRNIPPFTDELFNYVAENFIRPEKWPIEVRDDKVMRQRIAYYRDCVAIGRISYLNKKLQDKKLKHIILFLSSDYKSSNIFYPSSKQELGYKLVNDNGISINNKKVNYLRNVSQLYLRLLCEENTPEEVIENLKKVRRVYELRWRGKEVIGNETEQFLQERIEVCRNKFRTNSTFLRIDEFKDLYEELVSLKLASFREVPEILEKLLKRKRLEESSVREEIEDVLRELGELNITKSVLLNSLNRQLIKSSSFGELETINRGDDYVFGGDHHLPTIFLSKDTIKGLSFNDIVSHFQDEKKDINGFFSSSIVKLFVDSSEDDERILKRCLILLMLSDSSKIGRQNFDTLSFVSEYNFKDIIAECDFKYTLCWAYRRKQNYLDSISIAMKMVQIDNNDPRFYHGLVLGHYCLYEKYKYDNRFSNNNTSHINELQTSISYLKLTLHYYSILFHKTYDINLKDIVARNIFALMNFQIFSCILSYEEHLSDENSLLNARAILEKLKSDDINYYYKPEYLKSEAYLELVEFRHFGNPKKIEFAYSAVLHAISIARVDSLKNLLFRLRDQIIKEKSNLP